MAGAAVYQQLNQQASAMAHQGIYRLLSWMAMAMVACAFMLSRNKPGEGAPAGGSGALGCRIQVAASQEMSSLCRCRHSLESSGGIRGGQVDV